MRTAKPILIGALVGLALTLAALAGLYVSPLRQDLYFAADPDLADLRHRLRTYQDWLGQADARIALQGPEADSLRAEQARVWRDYRAWRTRLGELARAHAQADGPGFPGWAYSLRYWDMPAAAAIVLLGAFMGFLGARNRYRPARSRPGKAPRAGPAPQPSRAFSDFQDAVKQVARIAGQETRTHPAELPPTDLLPIPLPAQAAPAPKPKEPDTAPFPREPEGPVSGIGMPMAGSPPGEDGRATRLFQIGPGWGETPADAPPASPGLSMEDEDAPESDGGPQGPPGVMPPTTEVERVERRKEEVLKLARKGMTSSEISRRLRISQDQVEFIIRLRREKG